MSENYIDSLLEIRKSERTVNSSRSIGCNYSDETDSSCGSDLYDVMDDFVANFKFCHGEFFDNSSSNIAIVDYIEHDINVYVNSDDDINAYLRVLEPLKDSIIIDCNQFEIMNGRKPYDVFYSVTQEPICESRTWSIMKVEVELVVPRSINHPGSGPGIEW